MTSPARRVTFRSVGGVQSLAYGPMPLEDMKESPCVLRVHPRVRVGYLPLSC